MLRFVAAALAVSQVSCFVSPIPIHAPKTSALSAHNAHNGRRNFIQTITSVGTAIVVPFILPSIANARSGDSSNMKLPSYIDFLIEKNAQGLPIDPSTLVYQGPDIEIQLRRIGEAGNRLPEIVTLAEDKKWSQVQGIISGPLGTLLQTMNTVASIAGTKEATNAAKLVKADIFAIGAAATKKDGVACIKAANKAEEDLEKFVKSAFK